MPVAEPRASGFTLVEILIVVVILAILAAIVVPQFTSATPNTQAVTTLAQLQMIRSQIALYQGQHNCTYPDLSAGWNPLLSPTDIYGNINTTGPYGPYLRAAPINPLTNSGAVIQQNNASALPAPAHTDTNGWYYNMQSGAIEAARFNELTTQGL